MCKRRGGKTGAEIPRTTVGAGARVQPRAWKQAWKQVRAKGARSGRRVCSLSLSLSPHETPPQLLSPSSPPQSPSSVCCVRSPQLESHACQMMHSRPLRHSSAGISRGGSASDAADVARSSRRRPRALVLAVAVRAAAGLACFPDQLLLLPSSSFSRKSRLRARHPCRQLCS